MADKNQLDDTNTTSFADPLDFHDSTDDYSTDEEEADINLLSGNQL